MSVRRPLLLASVVLSAGCASSPPVDPVPQSPPQPETATAPRPVGKVAKVPGTKGGVRTDRRGARATPDAPGPTIYKRNGMVYVTGSWLIFGPRTPPAVPLPQSTMPAPNASSKGGPPGPPPMADGSADAPRAPGRSAADHGAGGAARAAGGPPGQTVARELAGVPDLPVAWEFHGGNGIHHTDVWVDAFWMDRTEVTRADYSRFVEDSGYRPPHVSETWAQDGWNWNGSTPPAGTEDHPVVLVSWYDAREYCAWAGKRLPTEAEWQLAALGPWGQSFDYPWGDTYANTHLNHGQMAPPNFDDSDGYLTTAPVGRFPSGESPFGALDMFGNAWEYTADMRVDTWSLMSTTDAPTTAHPAGKRQVRAPEPGLYVAVRGGSYFFDLRPNPGGERHRFLTEIRRKTSGFRCARTESPTDAKEAK
ncbi:MAG: hypothetical protein CL927_04045 [Deltaproteobacteria bacterium]|nr:hypothetical protein [Deltaproteobacteria bacterium]HCH66686.1 hypothetical protein [Deltaproteobacteria bacterium]